MPIKCLDTCKKFFIIPQRDKDLSMIPHGLLEDGERALADLVLFERTELSLVELRFWDVHVLTASNTSVSNHLEGYTHDTYLMVGCRRGGG